MAAGLLRSAGWSSRREAIGALDSVSNIVSIAGGRAARIARMAASQPTRETRRRRRDEVRDAVRAATLGLLETAPFNVLTVDEIARAAGLSRSAFYFYFRDKNDLLIAAAEDLAAELYREADRWWHGEGAPRERIEAALRGMVDIYERHAPLFRVATEVSTYDAE